MKNAKTKSTKRALAMSVLSLMLCVSMLVGTTFAWFTDKVESGTNKIVAGNLDIALYHTNDKDTNEEVTGTTKLFDSVALWEPGAVCYENFTVKNLGTLDAEYRFSVEGLATNDLNGKTLKDVIKVAVVDGGFTGTRTDAAALTNYKTITEFEKYGTLGTQASTNSDTYGIVLYWAPTDHDDDYNAKNGATTSDSQPLDIEFSIKVVATQTTSETDSFDKRYDEKAPIGETYQVNSLEDFNNILASAQNNDVIVVAVPDLTLNVAFDDAKTITLKGEKITKLTANAPYGTIKVYNDVGTVEGTVVAMNSAHLYGKVNTLDATKGHFVVEEVAEVDNIQTTEAAVAETLKIDVLGKVNTLTTEKGTIEIGAKAEVKTIDTTAETNDQLVINVEGKVEQLNVVKGTVNVKAGANVEEIETPAAVEKAIDIKVMGTVETLDVPVVSDNIVVEIATGAKVDEIVLAEGEEEALQVKNNGTIGNAEDLGEQIVAPFAAKIGNATYEDFAAAFSAAENGDVIKLTKDYNAGSSIMNITKAVTIDFGTSNIISTNTNYPVAAIRINVPGGEVTFKGTTGGIKPAAGTGCVCVTNGTLKIDGGEYETTNAAVFTDDTGTKALTVNGGKFTALRSSGYGRLINDFAGQVTINGGDFVFENTGSANYMYLIEMDGNGNNCTINGGNFTANGVGTSSKAYTYIVTGGETFDVTINGGTVNADATGSYVRLVSASNATVVINDINYHSVATSYGCIADSKSLTIEGGTFDMTPTSLGYGYVISGKSDVTSVKGNISGGTYSFHPGAFYRGSTFEKNDTAVLAEGYTAVQNENGTWTVKAAE